MTPQQQVHIKWNWQLSSDPEQLWMYVADTNRLFKNLNLPSIQPTGFPHQVKKEHLQLSYNSIKYSDVWTEEPFEWEYPFRYGVRRTYECGPFKEVRIRVDLFPNRKGTRLQYQLWAEPGSLFTAMLTTVKHKTIQRIRLKKAFKYYDELIERNCLPYEAQFEKSIFRGSGEKFRSIREKLYAGLNDRMNRLIAFVQQLIPRAHLKKAFKYCSRFVERIHRFYQGQLKKKVIRPGVKKLGKLGQTLIDIIDLKNRTSWLAFQTQFKKKLNNITNPVRSFLTGVINDLKNAINRLIDFVHRLLQRTRLKKAFIYCAALVKKGRLICQARFNKESLHVADLKNLAGRIIDFIQQSAFRLKRTFVHSGKFIEKYRRLYKARFKKSLARSRNKKLHDAREILIDATGFKDIVTRLLEFIRLADDIDLVRINPYQLADYWQFERKDVLFVFLHATKEGLLNFNWDLYCPSCRTIQQTCQTLNEVHEPVLCSDCAHNFTINFNQSIQLSFRPNPLIRKTNDDKYCPASPRSRPHVVIQQHLKAGQKRHLKTRLENGTYYLRVSDAEGKAIVLVDEQGQDTVNVRLSGCSLNGEQANICSEPNLIFENSTPADRTFILEKSSWQNTGVTAAQVTSLQVFRDLFAEEVLQKGEKIAVDRLTLMFTDLFDSAAMYQKEGDNQAVDHVIEHFEILQYAVAQEDGALVKTIGDSIMAVFSNPEQAFRAFIMAQKMISEDTRFGKSLKLKAGIHHGNCVAVNLNNRIDYFGSTVNIASRLADMANENEILFLESVAKSDKVQQLITDSMLNCTTAQESANLKGFETETFNIERIRLEKSHLRLAI